MSGPGPAPQPDTAALDILRSAAFADVLAVAPVVRLEPGDTLVTQGAVSDAAYFLVSGEITVFAETAYGHVTLATLRAPRLIGEIGVLADLPRTASIKAATAATLHRIDRPAMRHLGERMPGLLLSIVAQLGRQLDGVNKTIGLYTNALTALEKREFDSRILEDLRNPPPQLAEFATIFRRFAGQILDKRRHQDEMASAAVIQQSLLPKRDLLEGLAERLDIHAAMRPARDVGGDFYDVFLLDPDRLAFAIGDICGKGLPASLFMAIVVTVLRTAAREESSVGAAIARANTILCRDNAASMFATAFFGVLDLRTGEIEYCNCGHNAPLVVSADGTTRMLPATGLPLALYEDRSAAPATLSLARGESLVLFTDGVTEAVNTGLEEFGDDRLLQETLSHQSADAAQLVARLFAAVDTFAGDAEQADDITCIVVKLKGGG
ncbi:MAG: PP2C family protein-serine/threonine phosphatase [Hyphomicrobiaceae bacterium]